ncbi:LysE family transporter [Rasiella sp. SM2506]|uniref:LysE family transporter n=1 Tax=Rasiella sp. SM2506 TaxID=3423914 RepID=UPI003D799069
MIYDILMLVVFLVTGFLASGLGALPASSSNVAVITTTLEKSFRKGFQITLGAGLGSVVLSFIALLYSQVFTDFFEDNPWVQYTILFIFFALGVLILVRNWIEIDFENPLSKKAKIGRFWQGFLLAFINPPALIFWILIISLANTYLFSLSKFSPILNLTFFFVGIFLGKITTLYFYGKMSKKLGERKRKNNPIVYTIIGIALVAGSLVQFIRMLLD